MGAAGTASPLLRFKPHLRVEQVPGEAVYLISDQRVTVLHGEQIARLAPYLDGTRPLEGITRDTADALPSGQAARLVSRLTGAGLLCGREREVSPQEAAEHAYWEAAGLDGARAATARARGRVRVLSVGSTEADELSGVLTGAGLAVTDEAADLTLVLCDDYLDPALGVVDAEFRAAGRRWLPVRAEGAEMWIGPFFGDVDGPCWACLAERLWRSRPVEAHVQRMLGRSGPVPRPACTLPAARLAALQLAGLEAAKWLAGYRDAGQQALHTLDGLTLAGESHPVARRPQCPGCGEPAMTTAQVRAPVVLRPRVKRDTGGNGHRSLTPEQFMDRFGHLVDPLTGLVRGIVRNECGPAFFNSFSAGLNPAAGAQGLGAIRGGLRAACGGKGATEVQARVSALAEALERHSGHYQGGEATVRGSYHELAPDAIHPDTVQLYDERQYAGRDAWNRAHGPFQHVADPFDADAPTDWTPLWSVTERRQKLLPTALCYYGAPQPPGAFSCLATSNGTAAGGTLEDAVLQGFLELVERDALALWWYNRTRQPAVDPEAFDDPWIGELRRVHASLGREVWVLDLTADLGVPVMAALSRRSDPGPGRGQDIMFGFGAHFDPATALRRALTELNQMMPHVVAPDGGVSRAAAEDPDVRAWLRTATVEAHPYLLPSDRVPTGPGTHPYRATDDLHEDIEAAVGLLSDRGMELLVLDQTRPDVGLPVVRVVVPGLRPHWARYAPGRLFDVPVRLGRLPAPTRYEDLNPVPLFL
ncbi:TOMM precursor leader peptide-binding protein [Streptomyces sp. ICN988]|uniref:TOMM precursor leader peptide-binding protein n=1 Tax=Streptomyces sp. ICN988 TaxID=2983765 RepID=UPI0021E371BB|nr:TOMM precursor leader peptide-binding protein [Streptomyces sp. ICN988]MCV2458460.1 TOMM precursor leader peptide-binding protein [Streptomyces sp. ICN988]